jgi:hypothetical protein
METKHVKYVSRYHANTAACKLLFGQYHWGGVNKDLYNDSCKVHNYLAVLLNEATSWEDLKPILPTALLNVMNFEPCTWKSPLGEAKARCLKKQHSEAAAIINQRLLLKLIGD